MQESQFLALSKLVKQPKIEEILLYKNTINNATLISISNFFPGELGDVGLP